VSRVIVDERKLRLFLRQEAARAEVPPDMWQHIARQLNQNEQRPSRTRLWALIAPAIGVCVAASVFWLTVIPVSDHVSPPTSLTMSGDHRLARVSSAPDLPERQQVKPVRYELGPESSLVVSRVQAPSHSPNRMGGFTQ